MIAYPNLSLRPKSAAKESSCNGQASYGKGNGNNRYQGLNLNTSILAFVRPNPSFNKNKNHEEDLLSCKNPLLSLMQENEIHTLLQNVLLL